jgi:hypothetical protein
MRVRSPADCDAAPHATGMNANANAGRGVSGRGAGPARYKCACDAKQGGSRRTLRGAVDARRPTDDALLAALRLNDDHIRGLTRFDQQFVYVPLGALAAAVYAAPSLTAGLPDGARGVASAATT